LLATEIIDKITSAGGRIWLEDDKVRARLPESLRPLVNVIHECKPELMAELARRPVIPAGVRLIRWEPKNAPVQLSECSVATDPEKVIRSTLAQLAARLSGRAFLDGGWGLTGLLARLKACGCYVALDDPRKELQ
jgi:hypothetical protein